MAASPASQVYIFQDFTNSTGNDATGLGLFLYGRWDPPADTISGSAPHAFGGSQCASSVPGGGSSFRYRFQVTEIIAIGSCPVPVQDVQVDINGQNSSISMGEAGFQSSQLYQSPFLATTAITEIAMTMGEESCCFDVILAIPEPAGQWQPHSQTLMVDDTYHSIEYDGSWEPDTNATFPVGDGINFLRPLMNTTHRTSTVGDTLRFAFSGNSVAVYGRLLQQPSGSLNITYSFGGGFTNRTLNSNPETAGYTTVQLLNSGNLPDGDHIVTLALVECDDNQALVIDYILYTPSFNSLQQMPNITLPALPNTSSTHTSSTQPSTTSSSLAPPPTTAAPAETKTSVGPIVGGAVGGVCFLLAIALVAFFYFRRIRLAQGDIGESLVPKAEVVPNPSRSIDPYTLKPTVESSQGPIAPYTLKPAVEANANHPVEPYTLKPVPMPVSMPSDAASSSKTEDTPVAESTTMDTTADTESTAIEPDAVTGDPAELEIRMVGRRLNELAHEIARLASSEPGQPPPAYETL